MKGSFYKLSQFLLLVFVFHLFLNVQGQAQHQKIPTGDRPAIDFSSVPADAYYPGVIQVKFKPEMEANLESTLISASRSGLVELSHMEVDELNSQFGITQYRSLLHQLYTSRSFNAAQLEKHKDHGLHLWYELEMDGQADIIEALQAFNNLDVVEIAEPVFIKRPIEPTSAEPIGAQDSPSHSRWSPDDQFYHLQWGFKNTGQSIQGVNGTPGADIKAEEAWDIVTGNPDIIVAVIDGGAQYDHPDLEANMWSGIGPDGNNTTADNHGTHVSGTVAAVSNNEIGVAGTAGGDGSPETGVKIMTIDIFNGSHGMNNLELNVYAVDNGAVISQNSWGYTVSGVYNQSDLDGIDYFNDNAGGDILDGGITIFAAGNSDDDADWYPAYYSGTLAVASTDNKDKKSVFSNYGNWIDISAPGTDIASLGAGGNYYWMSGTSMACPHVSGVAALLLSHSPGTLTNQQLWDFLVDHADNIDTENPSYVGLLGTGRLNAIASLNAMINSQGPTHTITATAGTNGTVTPSGDVSVVDGNDQTFTIEADWGYAIEDVLVDGSSVGAVSTYTFTNVTQNHTLSASFSPAPTYIISATSGANGNISPSGDVEVYEGTDQTFSIEANPGYVIDDVEVDGISIGAVSTYTFTNVTQNHTIFAGFAEEPPDPCLETSLPYSEDFNVANLPDCWESNSLQGNLNWQSGTFSGGLSNDGSNYAYARATGNSTQIAELISPPFDFSSYSGINLEFIHYYNHFRSSASLAYSIDGGNQWETIQSWNSSTSNPAAFSQAINSVAGQANVKFKWTFEFDGGGNPNSSKSWSIDDIAITSSDPLAEYTITATSGSGGSITPSGSITVFEGDDQTFNITAETGYAIDDVLVDGSSVGAVNSYTFNDVNDDHTISASFVSIPTYTITATAGSGGSISPAGSVSVSEGDDQTFTISPDSGYDIDDVLVDNISVGAVNSYTFSNVAENHSIEAFFISAPVDPCVISDLPHAEDFDASSDLPDCWDTELISGSGAAWQVGTFSGGLSGTTGNYAYVSVSGNSARNTDLYSPEFDLSNRENIAVDFTYYYDHFRSSAGFYYSTDGGANWTQLENWNSSTGNPTYYSNGLPELDGQSSVIFRWNFDFTGGGNPNISKSFSIDDFEITGMAINQTNSPGSVELLHGKDEINDLSVAVYPNPTKGVSYFTINESLREVHFDVFNSTGQLIESFKFNDIYADAVNKLDLTQLPEGLLILRIKTDKKVLTENILKIN